MHKVRYKSSFILFISSSLVGMLTLGSLFSIPQIANAAVPSILSYQGRLTNAAGSLLGSSSGTTYYFKFSIWSAASGGTKLWPTADPTSVSATVRSGVFNVNIGDTANGYPDALDYAFDSSSIFLKVEVSSNNSTFETLSPRQQISSVAFAQVAGIVNGTSLSTFGGFISSASSTVLGNLNIIGNSTTTNATTTNFFSTTASSTNLFSTLLTSGSAVLSNLLVSASTTLQNFTGVNATTTNATTTNFSITSKINGAGLSECNSVTEKLLWANGVFTCGTDAGASGSGISALGAQYSSTQGGATQTLATSTDTNLVLTITSSSNTHTFAPSWTGTLAASRGGTGLGSVTANQLLVGNSAGTGWTQMATSSLGLLTTNVSEGSNLYYTDARVNSYINASTTIPKTYTANTFTAAQIFDDITRSTTTQATTTNFAITSLISKILKTDSNGSVIGAVAGTDYENPLTFSTGLSRSTNTITVDQTFSPTWTGAHIFNNITRSTTTAATTTSFFATTASTSSFFGAGLTTCQSNNVLTWSGGLFGCEADDTGGGGGTFAWTPTSYGNATSTTLGFLNGFLSTASSTLTDFTFSTATGTSATTTSFFSTTASSTNLFAATASLGSLSLGTPLAVSSGGSGASTLTGLLLGNGTSAFTGLTTSAGISGAISDETGSGVLVFGTSPTFTTQIISPIVYGSSAANGDITIEGTSNGTKTTSYVLLQPTSGNVGIGLTDPGVQLDVESSLRLSRYTNVCAGCGPDATFLRGRGSRASKSAVQADDTLGSFTFRGYDGSSEFSTGASFEAYVDGSPGVGDMPGRLIFATSPDGTAATVERLRITSNGRFGFSDTSPDYIMEITENSTTPTFGLSDDDVAHGVTTLVDTDTFFHFTSISTTVGGAQLTGLADATGIAFAIKGVQSSDPTDTTPAISLIGTKASGTGVQDLAAAETVLQIGNNDNTAAFTVFGNNDITIGSVDLGDGLAGPVLTLGRNNNGTNTGAGSINFQQKGGTSGYVWQDAAGNLRINTSAPSNANDTAGTVVGAQSSVRETKQDINNYTDYSQALSMIIDAPLHTFRYKKEVSGYGTSSPLAKYRIGYIADEVDPAFMVGNVIDQVSVNGILMASIKELALKLKNMPTAVVSSAPVSSVASALESFGIFVSNNIVRITKLVADQFTVGSAENPAGITIYDRITKEPRCIVSENGVLVNLAGSCDSLTVSEPVSEPVVETAPEPSPEEENPAEEQTVEASPEEEVSDTASEPVA